ncbi:hypothetical protein CCACVL1_16362 [Corchorus capsularis]|uniref:Uncharacterized protein n=1 Tax=Corchorus capsularis TaxID=210143 RepID=A0A1R3HXB0_COCAP|nr:hypothetical protein CCACVL1_16362 [Corchorus capsularis]
MIQRGRDKAFSSPENARPSTSGNHRRHGSPRNHQDITFEGIAANVKLLLKLIHEQSLMSNVDQDDRKTQRMAGMITILDDVKTRIQKCYSPTPAVAKKDFRRCNSDLKPQRAPRDPKRDHVAVDEKEMLKKEIHANCAARKSLEAMCSSLGKEKEIMASELSRKVQELNGMEELINDLKAQNETLLGKVQICYEEHRDNKKYGGGGDHQTQVAAAALQDRNKALSEQLLKSLDGYRSLKRKYKDAREKNVRFETTMEEMGVEVAEWLDRIHGLKQQLATTKVEKEDIVKEISALECLFQSFNVKMSTHMEDKSTPN